MKTKTHWETVYTSRSADTVSWFQQHSELSLEFIQHTNVPAYASIIDIGGGASGLIDDLIKLGYCALTVLDLSKAALQTSQKRIGKQAQQVQWIEADITQVSFKQHSFDIWHDRAVFHFLTSSDARKAYVDTLLSSVKPSGHVIIATFDHDGPERCSGLPVRRYNATELSGELGEQFTLIKHTRETHQTPFGTRQSFIYCHFQKKP